MDWLILVASNSEPTDILSVVIASVLGGGAVAAGAKKMLSWAAHRKRKGAGKYGWKWGTWLAVVDLDQLEKDVAEAKAEAAQAKAEAAQAKAEAARDMERARAIQREAEARVAKYDALIKQCQEHTASAIHERDELALKLARREEQ